MDSVIREILGDYLGVSSEKIPGGNNLEEYGISTVERLEIINLAEDRLGVYIEDLVFFYQPFSINSLKESIYGSKAD